MFYNTSVPVVLVQLLYYSLMKSGMPKTLWPTLLQSHQLKFSVEVQGWSFFCYATMTLLVEHFLNSNRRHSRFYEVMVTYFLQGGVYCFWHTQLFIVSKHVYTYKNIITTGYGERLMPPKQQIWGKIVAIIVIIGLKFRQNLYTARSLWNAIRALMTLIQQHEQSVLVL